MSLRRRVLTTPTRSTSQRNVEMEIKTNLLACAQTLSSFQFWLLQFWLISFSPSCHFSVILSSIALFSSGKAHEAGKKVGASSRSTPSRSSTCTQCPAFSNLWMPMFVRPWAWISAKRPVEKYEKREGGRRRGLENKNDCLCLQKRERRKRRSERKSPT